MRIPNFSISDSLVSRLQSLLGRQAGLQSQIASGQRITVASDDPAAMARVLGFQAEKQQVQQWMRNAGHAEAVSKASFSAIKGLKSISDRAGEISVLGSGSTGPDGFGAYAAEVNALVEQAAQVANSQYAGDRLFGGTRTEAPPFTITRDANGRITGVTYDGAATAAEFRISDSSTVSSQTDGTTNEKLGLFVNNLVALREALESKSGAAVQTAHAGLQTSETDLIVTLSDIGAIQTRLESIKELDEARFSDIEGLISADADVDVAQAAVKLTQTQATYQAALQSGASLLQHSLLDYLR